MATVTNHNDVQILSSNYPYRYPQNLNCTWNIKSGNSTNITIRFENLNLVKKDDSIVLSNTEGVLQNETESVQITWDQQVHSVHLTSTSVRIQLTTHLLQNSTTETMNEQQNSTFDEPVFMGDHYSRSHTKAGVNILISVGHGKKLDTYASLFSLFL